MVLQVLADAAERVDGRDAGNHRVSALEVATRETAPEQTVLMSPAPNPTHGGTQVSYALARAERVELAIYGVEPTWTITARPSPTRCRAAGRAG